MKFIINAARAGAVTATLCAGGWMLLVTLSGTFVFGGVLFMVKNCSEIGSSFS